MKKSIRLISLLALISMFGVFVLTAQEYVGCQDDFPDEFLDLAAACQGPTLPVLALHPNTRSSPMSLPKIFCFERTDFQTTLIRC